jgi:hypothetical protein
VPDLDSLRIEVLSHLGDSTQTIWSQSEIESYLQQGYKQLCMASQCLWEQAYLEDVPYTGTHTGEFEIDYLTAGAVYHNRFTRTALWEIDYDDNGTEPANHTSIFERDYLAEVLVSATSELPSDCYQIERATHDWKRIEPVESREIESRDSRYELTRGPVIAYLQDKDGLRSFRKYRTPSASCDEYEVDDEGWGIARDLSDVSSDTPTGQWGIPRVISSEFLIGPNSWGVPRRFYTDGANTRIEYFRRGADLDVYGFELPDLYAKYLRHFAMSRALKREGPGQDLELGDHYEQRFSVCLNRLKKRKTVVAASRIGRMGGGETARRRPARPSLPWQYGKAARY